MFNTENIKVLKHEKSKSGYFLKHKALVEIIDFGGKNFKDKEDKMDIVWRVSEKTGYNPMAYGLYSAKISKSSADNQYIIVWETDRSL